MNDCDYSWVEPWLCALYARISDATDQSNFMGLLDRIETDLDKVSKQMRG